MSRINKSIANVMMNRCKLAIENNLNTQEAIINHIEDNGSDDNIYLHGIRTHSGNGIFTASLNLNKTIHLYSP